MSTVTYLLYYINYIIMEVRIFLQKYSKISFTKTTLAIFFSAGYFFHDKWHFDWIVL
jgi:hypothetical protein